MVTDVGAEYIDRDGEQGGRHELPQHALGRQLIFQMAGPDAQRVAGLEGVTEERKPGDMIHMGMRQKQIDIGDIFGGNGFAKIAQSGSRIEHEQTVPTADFDAGGIAAVYRRIRSRTCDRATDAPEPDKKVASWRHAR